MFGPETDDDRATTAGALATVRTSFPDVET